MGTLQDLAIQIRDEQRKGANSSARVGGLLLEMAKLLESSESNNIYISDLSELDNYKMTTHKGAFNVYLRGNLFVGVLFIIQYQAPQHGGLQVFLSTFDYKMSGSSSLSMPSIIYRSTDYNNNQKWLEWKPYQNTFISDDGTVPTSGGLGFDNTNFAPSLRMFLEYPKIVKWSGIVTDNDANFEESSTINVVPSEIFFSSAKKTFYVEKNLKYYNSWVNKDDLTGTNGIDYFIKKGKLTKNIFKGEDGSVWIADSESSIKKIIDISNNIPQNGDIVLPDKSTLSLEEYQASGRTDAIGVVFDKHKGLYVKKDYFSGTLIANQSVALEIFYAKVKCHAPYDGRTTQKLNLLHSSNPSTEFPVFNYAEQNGVYVASNGEIEQIKKVNESLQAIKSNIVSFSYIASCTQRPKATSSASVFYGGAWGASDYRDPSTALNYLLIDIL